MNTSVEEIVWPTNPALRDEELWKLHLTAVTLLAERCEVVEWLDDYHGSNHFPHK